MTNLIDEAIEALRHVPVEQQERLARLVLQLAGKDQPVYVLSPDEEAELAEADAEIARGEFATDEDMKEIWSRYTL